MVREGAYGVKILKFETVAMEKWKCRLWGPIWPWTVEILQPDPLKIWIKWTNNFFDHLRFLEFRSVSMETVKSGFWCSGSQMQLHPWGKHEIKNICEVCLNKDPSSNLYRPFCQPNLLSAKIKSSINTQINTRGRFQHWLLPRKTSLRKWRFKRWIELSSLLTTSCTTSRACVTLRMTSVTSKTSGSKSWVCQIFNF